MARLSVVSPALSGGPLRFVIPIAKDARLRDDTSSIAAGVTDESFEQLRTRGDIVPVLLGSCAEVDNVCA